MDLDALGLKCTLGNGTNLAFKGYCPSDKSIVPYNGKFVLSTTWDTVKKLSFLTFININNNDIINL